MKFPSDNNKIILEVFYSGDDAMICGAFGYVSSEMIEMIEADFSGNGDDGFEKGVGSYLFEAKYDDGQFDEYGRCEIKPYWDLTEIVFVPMSTDETLHNTTEDKNA